MAILGVVNNYKGKQIPHIITSVIEHPAVLENFKLLEKAGKAEVTYVKVDEEKAAKIISEHVINNRPISQYTIGATER